MKRLIGLMLLAALLLPNRSVLATDVRTTPKEKIAGVGGRPKPYSNVGSYPRSPVPIGGWQDAIAYLNGEKMDHDVRNRLISSVPHELRPVYNAVIAPRYFAIVRAAVEHNYMIGDGHCHKCPGGECAVQKQLVNDLVKVLIEPGTPYLGMTEGSGRAGTKQIVYNVVFRAKGTYYAYRIYLRELPLCEEKVEGKTTQRFGETYIDLIVKCGNAALGEIYAWSVETLIPKPVPAPPVVNKVYDFDLRAEAEAYAKAKAEATAHAQAEGGSVVNNIVFPSVPLGYVGAPPPTRFAWSINAGGLTFQATTNVKQNQKQGQQSNNTNINVNQPVANATAQAAAQAIALAPVSVTVPGRPGH